MAKYLSKLAWQVAKIEMRLYALLRNNNPRDGVIVVATTYMGDFVMTIPLIEQIIKTSNESVDVAVRRGNVDIARIIPGVRHVYTIEKSYQSWAALKNSRGWNICVLALDNKWARFIRGVGCNQIIGFECEDQRWNDLLDVRIKPSPGPHYLGVWVQELWRDRVKFDPVSKPDFRGCISQGIDESKRSGIFVQLGASASSRTWPYENYKTVIEWLVQRGEQVLLAGGGKEKTTGERLMKESGRGGGIELIIDNHSKLDELRLLIKSKLYFGPDTGMTHMARLLGVPVVCMMGPSQLEVFSYKSGKNMDIYINNLKCRDKRTLFGIDFNGVRTCGRSRCPVEGFPCMSIGPSVVIEKMEDILSA